MKNNLSKSVLIATLSSCIIFISNLVWAALPEHTYSKNKNIADTVFTLQGVGKKSVLFMNAFEVGYYQERSQLDLHPLDNVAKHLEVRYFVNIPGKKLFNFNIDVMRDNYSTEELRAINDEIDQLKKYYVDLKKGDCYELTYIPEIGTKFKLNGELKGIIKGKRFAEILFSVWLGERPFDQKIKEEILGLRDKPVEENSNLSKT